MKKLIKLISLICIVALFAGCSLVSTTEEEAEVPKSETAVIINGVEYTAARFNIYYYSAQDEILQTAGYVNADDIPADFWEQKTDGKANLERAKEIAIDNLVKDALAYQKAEKLGIELTAEEKSNLTNQMAYIKQDPKSYEQIGIMGTTEDELMKFWEEQTCVSHILPALIEKGELNVDEAAAEKQLKDEYVRVKHILTFTINPQTQEPLAEDQVKIAEERVQEILAKINAGEDFDKLAEQYNQDGNVDYLFTKGEMVAEFETVAFSLADNQVSGPVYSPYGIHIIKKIPMDMKGEQEELKLQAIKSQMVMPDYEKLLEDWVKNAKIEKKEDVLKKEGAKIVSKK